MLTEVSFVRGVSEQFFLLAPAKFINRSSDSIRVGSISRRKITASKPVLEVRSVAERFHKLQAQNRGVARACLGRDALQKAVRPIDERPPWELPEQTIRVLPCAEKIKCASNSRHLLLHECRVIAIHREVMHHAYVVEGKTRDTLELPGGIPAQGNAIGEQGIVKRIDRFPLAAGRLRW